MDRERLVSGTDGFRDFEPVQRDYEPIQPRGRDWRSLAQRIFGPVLAAIIALAKFSFVLVKFSSIFIAVAAYALIWGWTFAAGLVFLILLHELGHFIEAKREGLDPKLPVFIPLLGAYVRYTRGNPWQTARVALAGPILGGIASLAFLLVGISQGSDLLEALAYFGFFLNLVNLAPVGFLDGGAVWRSAKLLRVGGGQSKATFIYVLYGLTAVALVIGMVASHVPQTRL
ncbi:MAG TPA: site-2 protease family protein [Gaiellaceae bacterium]|nr:site-2 protease family protein [Gaiellaceae bacterium]